MNVILHHSLVLSLALALFLPSAATGGASPPGSLTNVSTKQHYAALDQRYGSAYPDSNGTSMRKAGIILTVIGSGALALGIPFLAVGLAKDDSPASGVLLGAANYLVVPGIISLAVGIPLLVKGTRRRAEYYQWLDEQARQHNLSRAPVRMLPVIRPGRDGLWVGVRLRF